MSAPVRESVGTERTISIRRRSVDRTQKEETVAALHAALQEDRSRRRHPAKRDDGCRGDRPAAQDARGGRQLQSDEKPARRIALEGHAVRRHLDASVQGADRGRLSRRTRSRPPRWPPTMPRTTTSSRSSVARSAARSSTSKASRRSPTLPSLDELRGKLLGMIADPGDPDRRDPSSSGRPVGPRPRRSRRKGRDGYEQREAA